MEEIFEAQRQELSGTQGGRRNMFQSFLAANPFVSNLSPVLRNMLGNRFGGSEVGSFLSLLGKAPGQLADAGDSFRDYLGNTGLGDALSPGGIRGQLQNLGSQGLIPRAGQTLEDFRSGGGPGVDLRAEILNDPFRAQDIIRQSAVGGISGQLRPYASTVVNRGLQAFQDQSPGASPWDEFSKRGYNWFS